MLTAGKADVKLKLIMGDFKGIVAFTDAEATAAVEVRPYLLPGKSEIPKWHSRKSP